MTSAKKRKKTVKAWAIMIDNEIFCVRMSRAAAQIKKKVEEADKIIPCTLTYEAKK